MRNFTFLLCFLLTFMSCFGQNSTEKYNTYLRRYEYFDSNGNMTGYKQYNNYLNQWEYYKSEEQGYQIQQPSPLGDIELTRQVLSSKQKQYDTNLETIREVVRVSVAYIYSRAKAKGYSNEEAKRSATEFDVYYVNKVRYGKYDLSFDYVKNDLIIFLSNGAKKIACDNFKDCY